jgi:hypothetical protein
MITIAACKLIANAISKFEIELETADTNPHWRQIVDYALGHSSEMVQEFAALAMVSISRLTDCTSAVKR